MTNSDEFLIRCTDCNPDGLIIESNIMNIKKLRNTINEASRLLDTLCTAAGVEYSALPRANRQVMKVEKDHRRVGSRFNAKYAIGIPLTAEYFVAKQVVRALKLPPSRPTSWGHVDGVRPDVITCYAIAETLAAFRDKGGKRPDTKLRHADFTIALEKFLALNIDAIDYVEDIAC